MNRRDAIGRILSLAASAGMPARAAKSGITRFEAIPVRVPMAGRIREAWYSSFSKQGRNQTHFSATYVRLHTDDGLAGIGEANLALSKTEALLRGMVGRSPFEYVLDDSIGGIAMAVYDLMGKAAGVPVARLFAPRPKEKIVQTWWSQCYPPAVMASEAKLGYERGYRVHKIKARPWEDPVEQAAAICAAVPRDMKIWADANASWQTVDHTLEVVRKLAQFSNYFAIESPVPRQDVDAYRRLRGKIPMRIAEHIDGLDPMQWIREGLLDACIAGAPRFGETMARYNAMASLEGVRLWVENASETGLGQVFQAHQAAAYPGIEYTISIVHCLEDDLVAEPFAMTDGFYRLPQKPGLGVSLDENAVEKYRLA